MRECAELCRLLGQVLAVLAERQDAAGQLAEIRAVLAGFDWEFDDRLPGSRGLVVNSPHSLRVL